MPAAGAMLVAVVLRLVFLLFHAKNRSRNNIINALYKVIEVALGLGKILNELITVNPALQALHLGCVLGRQLQAGGAGLFGRSLLFLKLPEHGGRSLICVYPLSRPLENGQLIASGYGVGEFLRLIQNSH